MVVRRQLLLGRLPLGGHSAKASLYHVFQLSRQPARDAHDVDESTYALLVFLQRIELKAPCHLSAVKRLAA
jgi:hypothetical protein